MGIHKYYNKYSKIKEVYALSADMNTHLLFEVLL